MFSKKPDSQATGLPAKSMASKPAAGSTFSVIGSDVVITGDIQASADLHVDGTVNGDIACASLVQGDSSKVAGAIEAESARLAGHVKGSITARELVILKSARIEGDVFYDALTIEQGAQVDGRFAHRDAKRTQKPLDAATKSPDVKAVNDSSEPKLSVAN